MAVLWAAVGVLVAAALGLGWWSWRESRPEQLSRAAPARGNEFTRRGDVKAAAQEFQLAMQLDPRNANAYAELAHALQRLSYRDWSATPIGESPSAQAAVRDGRREAGLKTLLDITGAWRSHREQAWRRAPWRALLDDTEGLLSELETACALRNVDLLYIAIDPVYDKIRDHPRFQKIVDGMGLRIAAARN